MSWIKDNKFAAMLGGVTLAAAIALLYVGMTYRSHYSKALENYQGAAGEVQEFEAIPLYPNIVDRSGKTKALNEYRTSIAGLQAAFDKFRPKELKNITPQAFTEHAKAANDEVAKAFGKGTKLPEGFFLGFEPYTATLAREDATGLLNYQLEATKELMLSLAKAGPSQLQNIHRPKFPEEDGEKWQANPDDVVRSFPMEITFKGTERSARDFLSSIAKSPNFFYTVRSVRIMNEKQKAPLAADAKFESALPAAGAAKAGADPFGGVAGFVLPDDPPATDTKNPKPAPAATGRTTPAAPAPAPAASPVAASASPSPASGDTSRILNQVLGSEELQVFLRLDVLQFLPVKALPEVPKSKP